MALGEIIKAFRQKHKMSQTQFGKKVGVSRAYVSMLERNKNSRNGAKIAPTITTLKNISAVIGKSLDDLLNETPDDYINVTQNVINEEQAELLSEYQKLNAESKDLLLGLMKQLNGSAEPKGGGVNQTVVGNSNIVAGGNQYVGR